MGVVGWVWVHAYSPCIKTGLPLPLVGSHNQLEGNPPGQPTMKGDDLEEGNGPQEGDGPEDSDDLEEGDDSEEGEELLERDPEEQDQQMEQYSNSNAAEEDEAGIRPHPVGGGDSEENLNIATEESSGGSNPAQSVMVVSFRSGDYKTHEFSFWWCCMALYSLHVVYK